MDIKYKNVVSNQTFYHGHQSVVELNEVKPNSSIPTSDLMMAFFPIGFVIGWTGLFLMLSKLRTVAMDRMIATTNSLNKVQCKNCQFFSSNRYLKCAVQPSLVLTKEAESCPDYCPIHQKWIK
jgi:uncharacterized membrane protein YciS (DUF1049 family)